VKRAASMVEKNKRKREKRAANKRLAKAEEEEAKGLKL
jgi:hypothetical protein